MFVNQLCGLVSMLGTIIMSFVGCLAPCVGFRQWIVIPRTLEINGLGQLVGRIDSVVSNSSYDSFAFFTVSRFGFVFDGFVFELAE